MKTKIDRSTWNRKDHFEFFSSFEEPFHGVCVNVNCTETYFEAKRLGCSFFLKYLHKSLMAVNSIESFRYRILDGEVYLFDVINASPTIPRPDSTFGFSYMDYHPDFDTFEKHGKEEIERVMNTPGLDPATSGQNVIHYSSLPWLKFTSLSHARGFGFPDSAPKISFGKMTEENGRKIMPMSVHAHHGLVDGYDVGLYVEAFQKLLDNA